MPTHDDLEFINSLTPSGMPEHRLHLKVGSIIMLLRNLDLRNGLCNGTRLIVRHMHNHVIDAEVLDPVSHGQLYVALSLSRSFNDIHVKIEDTATQGLIDNKSVTQNFVYPEVLL